MVACALAPGPALAAGAGSAPFFSGLGDLPGGGFYSYPYGVSGDGGTVVGVSRSSAVSGSGEAFRWTEADSMVGLGDFGSDAPKSIARAVSFDGSVIVGRGDSAAAHPNRVMFRWTASTGLSLLVDSSGAAVGGDANDVSDDGSVIVGVRLTTVANEAFRWTESEGMAGLGWLPSQHKDSFAFGVSADGSVVCGLSNSNGGGHVEPTRWTEETGLVGLGDVPGGIFYAIGWAVSGDGEAIFGSARAAQSTDEMFVWREETGFVLPDTAHGAFFGSTAFAASHDGAVAVGYGLSDAMVWDAFHGMRPLRALLEDDFGLDLEGWTLGSATGVSGDGRTIVGSGINPAGQTEGWIARLPATVGVAPSPRGIAAPALVPIGPNPFEGSSALRLLLGGEGGAVRAEIIAPDGRRVRTLLDERLPAGRHDLAWDGLDHAGRDAGTGVFLLRVTTPQGNASSKLVRVR